MRILVVDDNVDGATTLSRLLEALGYQARAATSGAQALAEGREFRPEVVLLDLGMPGMDGFEAAARMRSEPWGATARIIALTGWGQAEDKRRTAEAGFAAHFVKPLDLQALLPLLTKD